MHSSILKQMGTMFALAGAVGCSSQGLSSREAGMQTYTSIIHPTSPDVSVSDPIHRSDLVAAEISSNPLPTSGPVHLEFPARVSVAQVGEISPPQSMLASLRNHHDLFETVSPQTGIFDQARDVEPRDRLRTMRMLASNLGSRYLLVFGGNIDSGNQ